MVQTAGRPSCVSVCVRSVFRVGQVITKSRNKAKNRMYKKKEDTTQQQSGSEL